MTQSKLQPQSRAGHFQQVLPWLRLAGFVAVVLMLSAWWAVHQVSAYVEERALAIGEHLDSAYDPRAGTSTLSFNGQRMSVTSVSSDQSVKQILDRFTELCGRSSGGITEQIDEFMAAGESVPPGLTGGRFGVLRSDVSERKGYAACFAREGRGGFQDLMTRFQRFSDTGDFASFGQLRYVYARRSEGSDSTHVLTVTGLGKLPLLEMFPDQGDAPGQDVVEGVRPPDARRTLAAQLEGSQMQLTAYESSANAQEALSAYDRQLSPQGYQVTDVQHPDGPLPYPTRVYTKRNDALVVVAKEDGRGHSQVTAFRVPNGGYASLIP